MEIASLITLLALIVVFILFIKMIYDVYYILKELQRQSIKLGDIYDELSKQTKLQQGKESHGQ